MGRGCYTAYRHSTVCFPHSSSRFKKHTAGSNMRPRIQKVLLYEGKGFFHFPGLHVFDLNWMKPRNGMFKYSRALARLQPEQIKHCPRETPDGDDLQATFDEKGTRLIKQTHHKCRRQLSHKPISAPTTLAM